MQISLSVLCILCTPPLAGGVYNVAVFLSDQSNICLDGYFSLNIDNLVIAHKKSYLLSSTTPGDCPKLT